MQEPQQPPLEISVDEAAAGCCPNRPLIDIREPRERTLGVPERAVPLTSEELLERCRQTGPARDHGGFVLCAEGVRSLELVLLLRQLGFDGYRSVQGGFKAWQESRLPVGYPEGFDALSAERYARHLVMPQVGPAGQRALSRARMLLVGLGGLNAPAALYLAAAGVGRLGLLDADRVARSNLQRQIIHSESTVGHTKVASARARLADLNPDVETEVVEQFVDRNNAADLLADWDIVVDGTDNFAARYALNDACVRLGKPLVYGAVMRFQGQVSVFWPAFPHAEWGVEPPVSAPCFRCLLPQEPAAADVPSCAEAGVLGVLPGIVGTLQATEAIKLVLRIGQPLIGRLLMIDASTMEFRQARIAASPNCSVCAPTSSRR